MSCIDDELIQERILSDAFLFLDLVDQILSTDPNLLILVDKQHHLPADYVPHDLIALDSLSWVHVNRKGHFLREASVTALYEMHQQAKREGITLLVSSTYRSYDRQKDVYNGWVNSLGQVQADRLSAVAGSSQHQLGTAIDFGSIDASFTGTKMERWLASNAHLYGFSLSYPQGYELETGYDYESWHYRYIGSAAVQLQRMFFNNLQYQMLEFWEKNETLFRDIWKKKDA
nr:M15 family metallopeptidase [Entomospira nematocera]